MIPSHWMYVQLRAAPRVLIVRGASVLLGCALVAAGAILPAQERDEAHKAEHFERRVRPILAAHCYSCHGPEKQESELRVDSRERLIQGGSLGPALVPGSPSESPLLEAVRYTGDIQMPPVGPLDPADVEALEQWIREGAVWPEATAGDPLLVAAEHHWSFQSVQRPSIPVRPGDEWSQTPIDAFIEQQLHAAGLAPAAPVDRATLARRAAYTLTGLPPPEDLFTAFLSDTSPAAYERYVEALLARPQHGEHTARLWLDLARYADNKGYVFFEDKNYPWAFTYRDYVVRALNEDLPYNRFVLEQLAADQLPDARPESLAALGLLTIGGHFMNNTHDILDDRIDVVTRGLLGLTVTCARCHDHKYDPIPQADYYSLYGVFASCEEPLVPPLVAPAPDTDEYRAYDAELVKRSEALRTFVEEKHRELVSGARQRVAEYLRAVEVQRGQPAADNFMLIADKGDINPAMIVRWQVYLETRARDTDPIWSPWSALIETPPEQFAARAAAWIAEHCDTSNRPALNPLVAEALRASPPSSSGELAERYGTLLRTIDTKWQETVTSAVAAGEPVPTAFADPAEEELRQALYGMEAPANVPMTMDWGFLSLFPDRATQEEYKKLLKAVEEWLVQPAAPARAMALLDRPEPMQPRIFVRGNPHRQGDAVPRQFLVALEPDRQPFQRGSGRLELAEAIVDPNNPLTARVLVNRIWKQHFGYGLVRTPSDFGLRGEPPTHPQLLDYLACELIDHDWSLKHLHRLIVTSAVYRQSSALRADAQAKDPENRLLWRMPLRRMTFEAIRDSAIAATGEMDRRVGGPPVDLQTVSFHPRRTLYGYIDRMDVPPLLTAFDFPNPSVSSPMREQTTVAPQALYLMNNEFWHVIAAKIASRDDIANLTGPQRIERVYQVLFQRGPRDAEREAAAEYLGAEPTAADWENWIHALLMTNEFVYVP